VDSLGVGLAALAFWGFVASAVVSGVWYSIREKQAQHETLQRMIESGQKIDADVIDKIVSGGGKNDTDLKIAAYITMSVAPGLVLLGYVLKVASNNDQIFTILAGVAGLVFFVAIGLLAAARVAERGNAESNKKPLV
jgi:hypothetical protein